MKISVLANDKAKEGFEAEHGFSLFIEHNGKSIILDTGNSEKTLQNAEKLGVDLGKADFLVLSHGHIDHTNAIEAFFEKGIKPKVVCHEGVFVKRYERKGDVYKGMPVTKYEIESETELIAVKKQHELFEGVFFLGEIPRKSDFEGRRALGVYFDSDRKKDDFVTDDSALAIKTENGLVVITGCAHSGISNICEYAKQITDEQKIYAIVGGLHLMDAYPNIISKVINYIRGQGVEKVLVGHCTGDETLKEFTNQALVHKEILAGETIEL